MVVAAVFNRCSHAALHSSVWLTLNAPAATIDAVLHKYTNDRPDDIALPDHR